MRLEVYIGEVNVGNTKIEFSFVDDHGCHVVFTAKDKEDRRILRAPVLEDGHVKTYSSAEEAFQDVQNRLKEKKFSSHS
jgi:hypothetical protein